jgi:hypothetical protein
VYELESIWLTWGGPAAVGRAPIMANTCDGHTRRGHDRADSSQARRACSARDGGHGRETHDECGVRAGQQGLRQVDDDLEASRVIADEPCAEDRS